MFASPYQTNSSEVGIVMQEVMQIAEDLRKLDGASRRRGISADDPIQAELVGGKKALLHDRLQYLISIQGRTLKIEEAKIIALRKAHAIRDLIAQSNKYVSGTGSEANYLIAEVFKSGIQEIVQV